jgi:PhzF family phenazine biosynthesis protein
MLRRFAQVDTFSSRPFIGNPVAVVLDGDGLDTPQMQRIAAWTNLSETTFVLAPTRPEATYRVRIFTPTEELPFAGHPTIGTCHAWLSTAGSPVVAPAAGVSSSETVAVQECGAGLVEIRRIDGRLGFAGPPLIRSGPVEEVVVEHIASTLRIDRRDIVDAEWADNGPGWVAVRLDSAASVLALRPGFVDIDLAVVGAYPAGSPAAVEVRAFFPQGSSTVEDPVTGSLGASLAPWLVRTSVVDSTFVISQGSVLGRDGRVHVSIDRDGTVWVAGDTITCVTGSIEI